MTTVAIVGDEGVGVSTLAGRLGKKGTDSDITFFNLVKGDSVFTFVDVKKYPETIKSLVQAVNMADIVLVCVPSSGLTARTGECIVALDLLEKRRGLFVLTRADESFPVALTELADKVSAVVKGTSMEGWGVVPVSSTTFSGMELLHERLAELTIVAKEDRAKLTDGPSRVIVDHFFTVKGVGCVILGHVDRGVIAKRDAMTVYPPEFGVELRSIQCNDEDVNTAPAGTRVGLSLKGGRAKDFDRGYLISAQESIGNKFELEARLSPFTSRLATSDTVHLFVGLQSSPATVARIVVDGKGTDKAPPGSTCTVTLTTGRELAYRTDDRFLIAQLNDPKQRLVAGGTLTEG